MRSRKISTATAWVVVVVATCLSGAGPSAAAEDWEKLLRIQLEDGKKCTLSGTVFVRQLPTREGTLISGRAKCFDGREFDFSQDKPHLKFEIKACEPAVC